MFGEFVELAIAAPFAWVVIDTETGEYGVTDGGELNDGACIMPVVVSSKEAGEDCNTTEEAAIIGTEDEALTFIPEGKACGDEEMNAMGPSPQLGADTKISSILPSSMAIVVVVVVDAAAGCGDGGTARLGIAIGAPSPPSFTKAPLLSPCSPSNSSKTHKLILDRLRVSAVKLAALVRPSVISSPKPCAPSFRFENWSTSTFIAPVAFPPFLSSIRDPRGGKTTARITVLQPKAKGSEARVGDGDGLLEMCGFTSAVVIVDTPSTRLGLTEAAMGTERCPVAATLPFLTSPPPTLNKPMPPNRSVCTAVEVRSSEAAREGRGGETRTSLCGERNRTIRPGACMGGGEAVGNLLRLGNMRESCRTGVLCREAARIGVEGPPVTAPPALALRDVRGGVAREGEQLAIMGDDDQPPA